MRPFRSATAARTLLAVSMMFASCAFCTSSVMAARPLMREIESCSFSPSITSATCVRYTGPPPCCATTMRPNCTGSLILPSTRTIDSVTPRDRRPAGTSWLASRIALITWSTPMPSAVSASGLICTRIWRVTRPLTLMRATPGRFSSALTIVWSVSEVSSRRPTVSDITASETTGWLLSWSARTTSGSFTSFGKPGRTVAILSRTSWIAWLTLVERRNST